MNNKTNIKLIYFLSLVPLINIDFLANKNADGYVFLLGNILSILIFVPSILFFYKKNNINFSQIKWILILFTVEYLMNINYFSTYFLFYYIVIIFGFYLGSYTKQIDLHKLAKTIFWAIIVLEIFLYIYMGSVFREEDGSNRLISTIGGPAASSFIFLLLAILFIIYDDLYYFISSSILLLLTANRISVTALIIVTIIYFFKYDEIKKRLLKILIFTVPIGLAFMSLILSTFRISDEYGEAQTGTFEGRLIHWNWALDYFFKNPFIRQIVGFGLNSTKEIFFISNEYNGELTGSGAMHNEYIRIGFECGYIGLFFLIIFVINIIKKIGSVDRNSSKILIGVTTAILICSITDNVLLTYNSFIFLSMYLIGYSGFNQFSNK